MDRKKAAYGCADYRREMTLVGMKKLLVGSTISAEERVLLEKQIDELEKEMGLD